MVMKILQKFKKSSPKENSVGDSFKKTEELKNQIAMCKKELNAELQRLYAQKVKINQEISELEKEVAEMNGNVFIKKQPNSNSVVSTDKFSGLKVGQVARIHLRNALESSKISNSEISKMLTKEYSKDIFGIDFPLLVSVNQDFDTVRYYVAPLNIGGKLYRLCSQWFETSVNNDRVYLLKWLESKKHKL